MMRTLIAVAIAAAFNGFYAVNMRASADGMKSGADAKQSNRDHAGH